MTETKVEEILKTSRKTFTLSSRKTSVMDFSEALIASIISQDTTGKNAAKAFENLSERFDMKPEVLTNVERSGVEERLKVAGLCRRRCRARSPTCKRCPVKLHCPSKAVCDENDPDS